MAPVAKAMLPVAAVSRADDDCGREAVAPVRQSPARPHGPDEPAAEFGEENGSPPPLVYVEVNIAPGKPPERLVLREGQTPAEAAAEFAVMHHLSPQLAQRLHELLKELLMNPELPGRGAPSPPANS